MTIFADPTYLREAIVLVDEVLLTMFGLTAEHAQQPATPQMDYVCGVDYYGEWRGSFHIGVPAALASELATRFIPGAGSGLKPDDIQDALGELANLIGGNLKALLPGSAHVTTPIAKPSARPSQSSWLLQFHCLGQPMWMWLDYAGKSVGVEELDECTNAA